MTEQTDLGNAFGTSAASLANRLSRRGSASSSSPSAPPAQAAPVTPPAPTSEQATPAGEASSPATTTRNDEAVPRSSSPPGQHAKPPAKRTAKKATHRAAVPTPAAVDVTAGSTVQVSVYLLPAALQAVRRQVKESRRTNADIAFAAIDATHERLNELVAQRRTVPRDEGSLFPSRVRHRATADGDRRILWSMQATPGELQVVDRLVAETGAASRSELIAVAIEAHLL